MRITESGRITIPKKLRERLGLDEGVEVVMFAKPNELFIIKWPPEGGHPGIVEMLEERITWAHHLPGEHSDDGEGSPYGVRALVKHGKIAIPQCYRDRYGLHAEAEADVTGNAQGMVISKCAPESADMKGRGELDPSVIGSAKGQGVFADLYDSVDDYINDIRGHVDDGS